MVHGRRRRDAGQAARLVEHPLVEHRDGVAGGRAIPPENELHRQDAAAIEARMLLAEAADDVEGDERRGDKRPLEAFLR